MKGGLHARYQALSTRLSKRQYSRNTARVRGDLDQAHSSGFTIVEVMIVLAVTGALFISAAVAISGRTNKTQFQQSINDVVTMMNQSINSTVIGYYPNSGNIKCQNQSDKTTITTLPVGTSTSGVNNDCIFLGNAFQFDISGNPGQVATFPIAALRVDSTGNPVNNITAANPAVIYPSSAEPSAPNDVTTNKLLYGLTVSGMYYNGNTSNTIGAFALIDDLTSYSYNTTSQLQSGSQNMILVPIASSSRNTSIGSMASTINANLASSGAATKGVQICFDSGTTDQSGLVTIGGSGGQQIGASVVIYGKKGCV